MRIGSMCTGYGGLDSAAAALLGGELAWVADNGKGARALLAHRLPDVPNLGDMRAVNWADAEPADVLCAGFPCQDISYAGQGKGIQEGNRSGLWYVIADAIGVLRPRLVLLENVSAIVARRPGLDVVTASLAGLGYVGSWLCLRASDVGAPHGRNRWFAAAYPGGEPVQRRGIPGILGSQERPAARDGGQRERDGHAAADRGYAAAEDADRAAGGERRLAAPGQAESGRSRADAGGPGRAPAADAERRAGVVKDGYDAERRREGDAEQTGVGGLDPAAYADRSGRRPDECDLPAAGQPDTDRRAAADAPGNGRHPRRPEPAGIVWRPDAPVRGDGTPADADDRRREGSAQLDGEEDPDAADRHSPGQHPDGRADTEWGIYEPAIRRWEGTLGRPAPAPAQPGRGGKPRLNPVFVEWMQGLPEGWVTDVPGLSRNDMLELLGNGVVPQQATAAFSMLLPAWLEAAAA